MATTDLTTNTPTGYQAGGRVNGLNCGSHHSRTEAFPVMDVSANLVSDIMLKPSGDATSPTSTTPNDPIKKARLAWRTRCDEQARRAAARHRRYMARLRAATLQRQRDAARATRRAERRTAATKALTNNVEVTRRRHRHVVLEIRARARERHACTKDTRTRARVHKRHARAQGTRVEYTRGVHTCGVHMRTPRCMARVIALLLLALTATILTSCDTTSPTTWICAPGAPRTSVRGAPNCASHRDTRRHQRTREEPARCLAAHTLGDGPTTHDTAHAHARGHVTDASTAGVSQALRLSRHLTHTKDTSALIDLPTHAITGVSHVGRDIVNVPVAASVDANALPTPTLLPHHRLRALSRRHGTDTPNTIDLTHWRAATPLRLTMAISRLYALYALYKCPALTGAVADVLHRALDTDHFAHAVERARANVASLLQCQLLRLRALGSFQSETSAWSKLYAEPHGSALALGYKPPPDERTNAYGGPHFANRRACGHYTLAVTQALLRLLFAKILDRHGLLYYTTHARVANAVRDHGGGATTSTGVTSRTTATLPQTISLTCPSSPRSSTTEIACVGSSDASRHRHGAASAKASHPMRSTAYPRSRRTVGGSTTTGYRLATSTTCRRLPRPPRHKPPPLAGTPQRRTATPASATRAATPRTPPTKNSTTRRSTPRSREPSASATQAQPTVTTRAEKCRGGHCEASTLPSDH